MFSEVEGLHKFTLLCLLQFTLKLFHCTAVNYTKGIVDITATFMFCFSDVHSTLWEDSVTIYSNTGTIHSQVTPAEDQSPCLIQIEAS